MEDFDQGVRTFIVEWSSQIYRRSQKIVNTFGPNAFSALDVEHLIDTLCKDSYNDLDNLPAVQHVYALETIISERMQIRVERLMLDMPMREFVYSTAPMQMGTLRRRIVNPTDSTVMTKSAEVVSFDKYVSDLLDNWKPNTRYNEFTPFFEDDASLDRFYSDMSRYKLLETALVVVVSTVLSRNPFIASAKLGYSLYVMFVDNVFQLWSKEKSFAQNIKASVLSTDMFTSDVFMRKFMSTWMSVSVLDAFLENNLEDSWKKLGDNMSTSLQPYFVKYGLQAGSAAGNYLGGSWIGTAIASGLASFCSTSGLEGLYDYVNKGFSAVDGAIEAWRSKYLQKQDMPPELRKNLGNCINILQSFLTSLRTHIFGIEVAGEKVSASVQIQKCVQALQFLIQLASNFISREESRKEWAETIANAALPSSQVYHETLLTDDQFAGLTTSDAGSFTRATKVTGWNVNALLAFGAKKTKVDRNKRWYQVVMDTVEQVYPAMVWELRLNVTQFISTVIHSALYMSKNLSERAKTCLYIGIGVFSYCLETYFNNPYGDAWATSSQQIESGDSSRRLGSGFSCQNIIYALGMGYMFGTPHCSVKYKCWGPKLLYTSIKSALGCETPDGKHYVCDTCVEEWAKRKDDPTIEIYNTGAPSMMLMKCQECFNQRYDKRFYDGGDKQKSKIQRRAEFMDKLINQQGGSDFKDMLEEMKEELRPIVIKYGTDREKTYSPSAFVFLCLDPISVSLFLQMHKLMTIGSLQDLWYEMQGNMNILEKSGVYMPMYFWKQWITHFTSYKLEFLRDMKMSVKEFQRYDRNVYNVLKTLFDQIKDADSDTNKLGFVSKDLTGKVKNGINAWIKQMQNLKFPSKELDELVQTLLQQPYGRDVLLITLSQMETKKSV